MIKIEFRSADAIALANELMPEYDKFMEAERLIRQIRTENMQNTRSWKVEAHAQKRAEEIDPGHKARRIQYSHLLLAADEVIDNWQPIKPRSKPKWGRVV